MLINKTKDKKDPFEAFEFPIHKIMKEQLQQPIFGSNYLHAYCKPKHPEKYPKGTRIQLKAYFTSGGFSKFISIMRFILTEVKPKSKSDDPEYSDKVHIDLLKALRTRNILTDAKKQKTPAG